MVILTLLILASMDVQYRWAGNDQVNQLHWVYLKKKKEQEDKEEEEDDIAIMITMIMTEV